MSHLRVVATWVAFLALAALVLLALAFAGLALGAVALVRDGLGDRTTPLSNRLLRLHQRLREAGDKLDAAVRICLSERMFR